MCQGLGLVLTCTLSLINGLLLLIILKLASLKLFPAIMKWILQAVFINFLKCTLINSSASITDDKNQ